LRFLLVDDGSSDGTAELAEDLSDGLGLVVLRHDVNLGPGRAFATAFEYLSSRLGDDDCVVTMEGDNTSRLELLRQMTVRSREGYDVVFASPYMYGGGVQNTSAFRVFLSHMSNAFVKEFLGIHGILTMSSFFRFYRAPALRKLQSQYGPGIVERAGFESMVEMTLKMIYLNIPISEVPMVLDTSQRAGKSKMKVMRTIFGYLTLWAHKNRWRPDAGSGGALG